MLKREAVENIGRSSRDTCHVGDIAYLSLIDDGEDAYLDILVQELAIASGVWVAL